MKIDNSLKSPGGLAGQPAARNGKADAATPGTGISVELSGLSVADGQAAGGEALDAARVAEIKQAIADGRFQVNPDVVADRLLQAVRELISASGNPVR